MSPAITASSSTSVDVTWQSLGLNTSYTITLFNASNIPVGVYSISYATIGSRSYTFAGLTASTVYSAQIVATQGIYSITCPAGTTITPTP
jgi:hypothetical protein